MLCIIYQFISLSYKLMCYYSTVFLSFNVGSIDSMYNLVYLVLFSKRTIFEKKIAYYVICLSGLCMAIMWTKINLSQTNMLVTKIY